MPQSPVLGAQCHHVLFWQMHPLRAGKSLWADILLSLLLTSSSSRTGYHGTDTVEAASVHLFPNCCASRSSGQSLPGRGPSISSSPCDWPEIDSLAQCPSFWLIFKLPGLYITLPLTSHHSIGPISYMLQDTVTQRRSQSIYDTLSCSPWGTMGNIPNLDVLYIFGIQLWLASYFLQQCIIIS